MLWATMPSSTSCTEYATSSAKSITCASRQRRSPASGPRNHENTAVSSSYTPNFRSPARRGHGYLVAASKHARVRLRPTLRPPSTPSGAKVLASSRVSRRSVWALPSKPPTRPAASFSARSPLCPNGGWPRSWARHAVSTMSGSQPSVVASSRPICATSRLCVSRLRTKSSVPGPTTWVLAASRRSIALCSTRARSRANAVRPGRLTGSETQRSASCSSYPLIDRKRSDAARGPRGAQMSRNISICAPSAFSRVARSS